MLSKVKTALRLVTSAFDSEILDLIIAGIKDLELDGTRVDYTPTYTSGAITDYTITDPLLCRAVITYCKCNFGQPDNYNILKASYDEQKAQLRANSRYMEQ